MLRVSCASSLEPLADACAAVLAYPLDDALASEWIATPTGGVRGWLQRRFAGVLGATGGASDGVAANIEFVRADGLRRLLTDEAVEGSTIRVDRWSADAMSWALMVLAGVGTVDRRGEEPLAAWARRQANRFARYRVYRPDLVEAWLHGDDDGDAAQARLYRSMHAHIGHDDPLIRLGARGADGTIDRVARVDRLPQRLVFFGFTLPPDGAWFERLVLPVAAGRDVYGYFLDPSPTVGPEERHGLAASWGRPAVESRRLFAGAGIDVDVIPRFAAPADRSAAAEPLLGRWQRAIAGESVAARKVADGDRSVVVHDCQGLARQVEVLRDEILHRVADDASLSEEDIVVFCPDPDAVAPVVAAVLGESAPGGLDRSRDPGTPTLRYHIDGLSSRRNNPVADAFARLLELSTGRISSIDLLAFCQLEAVRRRWHFDDEDIATFRRWATDLNVRWGIDPDHRAHFGIPAALVLGTWQRALRRLALGVAHASDDLVIGTEEPPISPVGIEGDDVARLGRLQDLVTRLADIAEDAVAERPVGERLDRLAAAVHDLFDTAPERTGDLDAVARICTVPDDVVAGDWVGDTSFPVTLADLRPHLLARLPGRGSSAGVFRGGVTFTTPDAVRGVPYRVAAFLGLDDSWVPGGQVDAADLIGRGSAGDDLRPRSAPDARLEARFSLLTAIGCVSDAVVVTRDARSATTNRPNPEGMVLGGLLDALDALVDEPDGARGRIVSHHPRHGTDPQCFTTTSAPRANPPWFARSLEFRPGRGERRGEPFAHPDRRPHARRHATRSAGLPSCRGDRNGHGVRVPAGTGPLRQPSHPQRAAARR